MKILLLIFLPLIAYLLGSIPFGLVLTRVFTSVDIRTTGSGNIGATNVRRTAGNVLGLFTLIGDVLKGALPAAAAASLTDPSSPWTAPYLAVVGLCAFAGHLYPLYLRFRGGGKGVATAAGALCVISPVAVIIALMVFVMIVLFTGRVSLGSMTASVSLIPAFWESTGSGALTAAAAVTAAFILLRHRENIARLFAGTEPSVWK